MEEKVLYINLPDGADYRRVEVTEDGRIGIVYTEQEISSANNTKAKSTVSIPKPIPLIGGTEVYRKYNGTPYWYCRIKEGRDEFMHLYFEDLTERDVLYDANGKKRKFKTERQQKFKVNALKAVKNKPTEGFRWIPVFEPSKNSEGELQYVAGAKVLRTLNSFAWENLFNEYSPDNGSQEASITTYFLLALRWLKDGIATIEQLTDDSKEIGHYRDSENAKHGLEKTGEREFGGLYGLVGNTYKIVKDSESGSDISLVGGSYNVNGNWYPLADARNDKVPHHINTDGVGLLELTK